MLLGYSRAFVDWTKSKLATLDIKTWKKFNMNEGFHARAGITKPYLPRKESGRALISVENFVKLAIGDIASYVSNNGGIY